MEVHHHSHSSRKKFTHYLWEFLMLFLAVFCGFLAEYQLEHKIEKDREKQYVRSLYFDLKKDRIQADSLLIESTITIGNCDSLLALLGKKDLNENSEPAFKLWRKLTGFNDFVSNDGTIQQLKNSGSLRLIQKQELVGKLLDYIKITEVIRIHQAAMNSYMMNDKSGEIFFDLTKLYGKKDDSPVPLLNKEKQSLSWAFDRVIIWQSTIKVWNRYLKRSIQVNDELSELIRKDYSVNQ